MFRIEFEGFDEIDRQLKRLAKNARRLEGENRVPLSKILNDGFMRRGTKYQSLQEMLAESPFKIESQEDFEAVPDAKWDEFIRDHTSFSTWREMLTTAAAEMFERELFS